MKHVNINSFKNILILLLSSFWSLECIAQCPSIDFNIPLSICSNETIEISNLTVAGLTYEWDFCEGDFDTTPIGFTLPKIVDSSTPRGIDIIKDGENWHAFVTSRGNNSLIRIDFGTDLNNSSPSYINLGNIDGLLSGPEPIRIINEASNWYALIHNGGNQTLVRVDFGNDILSLTSSATLVTTSVGTLNSSMDIGKSQGKLVVVVSRSNNELDIINFGSSITNIPQVSDNINTGTLTGLLGGIIDLKLINQCDQWYALAVSFSSGRLYVLEFGDNLFSIPTLTQLGSNSPFTGDNPFRIEVAYDNNNFIGLVTTQSGNLHQINLGNDLSNIDAGLTTESLGDLGILNVSFSLDLVKDQSKWYAFTLNNTSKDLYRIVFNNDCPTNISSSNDQDISEISYSQSGIYNIGLTSVDNNGNIDRITKSITVTSNTAPDISTSSENICLSNPINFTSINTSGDIDTYTWDFGDANTSLDQNPIHTYASAGEYEITLDVVSSNGCHNFTKQMITIYDEPVPGFTLPAGAICTNENYTFVNNTIDNFDGNLTYEWQVNGAAVSNSRDLIHQFNTQGAKELKLITSILGCSIEQIQNITNVNLGAIPFYTYDTNSTCLGDPISFTNESTGDGITDYAWDFGDTNTSIQADPTHNYSNAGEYAVILSVTNAAGCVTTYQEEVIVRSLPITDFSAELACINRETLLSDLSTVDNANITTWDWDFGDTGSGSNNVSFLENPLHTFSSAGDFNVSLSTTSNFGCESSVQKVVTVLDSPIPDFNFSLECIGEAFHFSDNSIPNSGGSIISYVWNIDGSIYTIQNPSHTFLNPGTYNVTLTIRSDNLCSISISKSITVNELPEADFLLSSNCINTDILIEDQSTFTNDEIVNWQWTINGEIAGNNSDLSITFNEATTQLIQLQIITARGCIISTSKNINFFEVPTADFEANPEYSAPPAEINFNNLSTGATNYEWSFGDDTNSAEASPNHIYNDLGTYDVQLIANNAEGCTDQITKQIYVVNPEIDLSIDEITAFNNGESLLFTISNNGNIPIGNITVEVSFNNELSVKETFDMIILPGQTAVPKSLSFSIPDNGNIKFLCITISTSEGIDKNNTNNTQCINIESEFEILTPYPSPASREETLTLPLIGEENEEVTISLINTNGKQFFSKNILLFQNGLNNFDLSLFSLKPGIYFIQVQSSKSNKNFRIFVN